MEVSELKKELVKYGRKILEVGLVAGAGGNISARLSDVVYLSASGLAFDEMNENDYIAVDIKTGEIIDKNRKPTSETAMHLGCYRVKPEIRAIVHTHSPWAGGVISSGANIEPMFPEFVCEIDKVGYIEYIVPTTQKLADSVSAIAKDYNVILMRNHGVLAFGENLREAFYRSIIIEEASKSLIAAKVVGNPRFFTKEEIEEIRNLESTKYRRKVIKSE